MFIGFCIGIMFVTFSLFLSTLGNGQWQWDFKLPKGGGTMGSFSTRLEAYVWRFLNPHCFKEGSNYRLFNYSRNSK